MTWAASLAGGALGAVGNIKGGETSAKGTEKGIAEQARQFNTARSDLAPWRETGQAALEQLSRALGLEGYRTDEENAYRKFLETKPQYKGPGNISKSEFEKMARMGPAGWILDKQADILGEGAVGGILGKGGQVGPLKDLVNAKSKRMEEAAREKRKAVAAYGKELATWEAKRTEFEGASKSSLTNYDPAAASRSMLEADPSYKFRMSEGEKGLNRSIAATTGVLQPGASKELLKYGSDYASNEWTNYINRLANAAGLGQTAAQGQANIASNAGMANAGLIMQAGNARAGAINNAYGSVNNAIQGGVSNYYTMSMYDKLLANKAA